MQPNNPQPQITAPPSQSAAQAPADVKYEAGMANAIDWATQNPAPSPVSNQAVAPASSPVIDVNPPLASSGIISAQNPQASTGQPAPVSDVPLVENVAPPPVEPVIKSDLPSAAPQSMAAPSNGVVTVPAPAQPNQNTAVAAAEQVHNIQSGGGPMNIEPYLEEVIRRDASDVHLQVGLPAMIRVDGALTPIRDTKVLTADDIDDIVFNLLDEEQKEIYIHDKEIDFSFAYGDLGRFRVNAFHEKGNPAGAFRLIPNKIRTVEDLGLPQIVNKMTEFPRGLVLVTGPTGSGKSTSLAAMVDKINREKALHIITIEDPIEYQHHHKKSIVVQREVHFDTPSFSAALRSALREDPDVVLIGEMRDLETISTAITVAETGHLVLATLHTNSAASSIDRMIDVFPPHQQQQIRIQLSGILQAVVAQRLVPLIGGGRLAAAEILMVTPAVRNIIREGKTHQLDSIIQTGADFGMQSMDATLGHLINDGKISYEEAKNYAVNLEELDRLMRH
ncbi:MAG: PilT/PilU family type 4a pilus ATPase [bacterium]